MFFRLIPAVLAAGALLALGTSARSAPQKIQIWHYLGPEQGGKFLSTAAEEFNRSQSKYQVQTVEVLGFNEITLKIVSGLRAGGLPTMALVDNGFFTRLALGGQLEDLSAITNGLPKATVQDFYPVFWNYGAVKLEGKTQRLGLPWAGSTIVLYYNADAFKAKGIAPPRTWEEFAKAAKALTTRASKGALFITDAWFFASIVSSMGGNLISDDGKPDFNSPEAIAALRFFHDLARGGQLIPRSFGEATFAVVDFLRTKAFMVVSPTSAYPLAFRQSFAFQVGTVPLPGKTLVGEAQWAVFKSSSEEQERGAVEFWQHLMKPENLARFTRESYYLPVRQSAVKTLGDFAQKENVIKSGLEALQNGYNPPHLLEFQTWRGILETQVERSLKAGVDPKAAMEEAQRQALAAK